MRDKRRALLAIFNEHLLILSVCAHEIEKTHELGGGQFAITGYYSKFSRFLIRKLNDVVVHLVEFRNVNNIRRRLRLTF